MDDLKNKTDEELDAIREGSASNAYVPGSIFHRADREIDRRHRKNLEAAAMGPQTFIENHGPNAKIKGNTFIYGSANISQTESGEGKINWTKWGAIWAVVGIVVAIAIALFEAQPLRVGGITIDKVEVSNSSVEVPLEKPDGILRKFTFANRPMEVVVDQGRSMIEGRGWSYSEGIVVLDIAPNFDIYGRF